MAQADGHEYPSVPARELLDCQRCAKQNAGKSRLYRVGATVGPQCTACSADAKAGNPGVRVCCMGTRGGAPRTRAAFAENALPPPRWATGPWWRPEPQAPPHYDVVEVFPSAPVLTASSP